LIGIWKRVIYIYRDGRDVLLSLWRSKGMRSPCCYDMDLAEWLQWKIDWRNGPAYKATKLYAGKYTVVEHWKEHMDKWRGYFADTFPSYTSRGRRALAVRYEELKLFPERVIPEIAEFFGLKWDGEVRTQDELVGYIPNQGQIGRWRDFYGPRELELFHEKVPEVYWGLWDNND
jgi:hypothetical protein